MHLFKKMFEGKNINRLFWFLQLFPKMRLKLKKKVYSQYFKIITTMYLFLFFTELSNSVFNNQ